MAQSWLSHLDRTEPHAFVGEILKKGAVYLLGFFAIRDHPRIRIVHRVQIRLALGFLVPSVGIPRNGAIWASHRLLPSQFVGCELDVWTRTSNNSATVEMYLSQSALTAMIAHKRFLILIDIELFVSFIASWCSNAHATANL
jgi:hypothetical protein